MLAQLQAADTLAKFASAIGYSSRGLSYIIFTVPDAAKYTSFAIPKRSSGLRTIDAPTEKLKHLQMRLANVLAECNLEIQNNAKLRPLSHGFEIGRSIFTNAWEHKNRRYVLNIDIADFFPSLNFGRVRGFFLANKDYALPVKAATLIAQIACFQGRLPQGSPCSPIIANLIAHILDVRMARLAKTHTCTYSRYADDLTISTNQRAFPAAFAEELVDYPGSWVLSDVFLNKITRSGFRINHKKTRMQCRSGRQEVTGLTVNKKVNIRATYYRKTRQMCSSLFNHGHYFIENSALATTTPATPTATSPTKLIKSTASLEGILSHIYYIKHLQQTRSEALTPANKTKVDNKIRYPAYRTLYKKFLYFKHFIDPTEPLIMCEGKTDNIYLRSALKALASSYPQLAEIKAGSLVTKVRFLKHSRTDHDILELSGGSGNIANFISHYKGAVFKYKHRPMKFPIIVLVDNDSGQSGGGGVFSQVSKLRKPPIVFASSDKFYHLCHNLYLVKTPERGPTGESCMEDLFDAATRRTVLDGKTFNPKDDKDTATQYGKFVFADKVVRANYGTIDFSQFNDLLNRIQAVIDHYKINKAAAATV